MCGHLLGLLWGKLTRGLHIKCSAWVLHGWEPVQDHICIIHQLLSGIWPEASRSTKRKGYFIVPVLILQESPLGLHLLWEAFPTSRSSEWELPSPSLLLDLPPSPSLSALVTYFVFKNFMPHEMGVNWGQRYFCFWITLGAWMND